MLPSGGQPWGASRPTDAPLGLARTALGGAHVCWGAHSYCSRTRDSTRPSCTLQVDWARPNKDREGGGGGGDGGMRYVSGYGKALPQTGF